MFRFNQHLVDLSEQVYDAYKRRPLGRGVDPRLTVQPYHEPGVPAHVDPLTTTFGVTSDKSNFVYEVLPGWYTIE